MGMAAWLGLEPKDIAALFISNLLGFAIAMLFPDPAWRIYVSILVSYHLFLAWLVFFGEHEAGLSMPLAQTIFTHGACVFLIVSLGLARAHVPFFGILRYAIVGVGIFERKWMFSVSRGAPKHEAPGPIDLLKPRGASAIGELASTAGPVAARPLASIPQQAQVTASVPVAEVTASAPVQPAAYVPQYTPTTGTLLAQTAAASQSAPAAAAATSRNGKQDGKKSAPVEDTNPILNATAQDHEEWLRYCSTRNPTDRKAGMTVKEEYERWLLARFRVRAAESTRTRTTRVAAG